MKIFFKFILRFCFLFEISPPAIFPPTKLQKFPFPPSFSSPLDFEKIQFPRISLSPKIQLPPPPIHKRGGGRYDQIYIYMIIWKYTNLHKFCC